jgi:hypothetical protein
VEHDFVSVGGEGAGGVPAWVGVEVWVVFWGGVFAVWFDGYSGVVGWVAKSMIDESEENTDWE